jgi:hypothetical protein
MCGAWPPRPASTRCRLVTRRPPLIVGQCVGKAHALLSGARLGYSHFPLDQSMLLRPFRVLPNSPLPRLNWRLDGGRPLRCA